MEEATRRELMKRLGLVALAGYVAPSVAVVRDALADDDDGHGKKKRKKKRPPPSGLESAPGLGGELPPGWGGEPPGD